MVAICDYLKLKLRQKGQGIVEYALLLAFIVGIAMMLNGVGLGNAVKGVFDDTAELLANFTDSRTPEEKDYDNMKKIAKGLAANFKYNGNKPDANEVEKNENAVALPKNYLSIVVLPDGTVDAFIENAGWYSDLSDANKAKYDTSLKNAGIDLSAEGIATTRENLKINSDDGSVKNGYAVGYAAEWTGENTGKMVTTYVGFNNQVTKDTYKDTTNDDTPRGSDLVGGYYYSKSRVTKLDL